MEKGFIELENLKRIRILHSPASLTAFRIDGEKAVVSTGAAETQAVMLADIVKYMGERGIPEHTIRGAVEIGLRNARGQANGR